MYDQVYNRVPYPPHSCLDATYQRKAIDEGWLFSREALFPENKEYYESQHQFISTGRTK